MNRSYRVAEVACRPATADGTERICLWVISCRFAIVETDGDILWPKGILL